MNFLKPSSCNSKNLTNPQGVPDSGLWMKYRAFMTVVHIKRWKRERNGKQKQVWETQSTSLCACCSFGLMVDETGSKGPKKMKVTSKCPTTFTIVQQREFKGRTCDIIPRITKNVFMFCKWHRTVASIWELWLLSCGYSRRRRQDIYKARRYGGEGWTLIRQCWVYILVLVLAMCLGQGLLNKLFTYVIGIIIIFPW